MDVWKRNLIKEGPMTKRIEQYSSPTHKILALLHTGREKLRQKYKAIREDLRVSQNQVRAVEKSREMWRSRAEAAEEELQLQKKTANRSVSDIH
jgi:hypothetical protein